MGNGLNCLQIQCAASWGLRGRFDAKNAKQHAVDDGATWPQAVMLLTNIPT
jgi:hypothetical protein